jgi:hypothetical protein
MGGCAGDGRRKDAPRLLIGRWQRLITHFSGMATILTWKGIILPLLISMTVGILFGLYLAIRAARPFCCADGSPAGRMQESQVLQ